MKGYQRRGRPRQLVRVRWKTALAGRAAWGVLGSAAGGHVFVLGGKTQILG